MSEVILTITEEGDGYYNLWYKDAWWSDKFDMLLASPINPRLVYTNVGLYGRQDASWVLELSGVLVDKPYKPKRRRSVAKTLGLRRPSKR